MKPINPANVQFRLFFTALILSSAVGMASGADWMNVGSGTNQTIWGLRDGLRFAIFPGGFGHGNGGPRGLIRIGSPTLPEGRYDLINFIAIEPVVDGVRGYSEMEKSHVDGQPGKAIWSSSPPSGNDETVVQNAGTISSPVPGVEELKVPLQVEKFDNGAHVRLVLSQRSDAPEELHLTVFLEPDSAPSGIAF